jgi:hypothetical protein
MFVQVRALLGANADRIRRPGLTTLMHVGDLMIFIGRAGAVIALVWFVWLALTNHHGILPDLPDLPDACVLLTGGGFLVALWGENIKKKADRATKQWPEE